MYYTLTRTYRAAGVASPLQTFDPWGAVWSGTITSTEWNYTNQRKDAGTGLLFYTARYYDPALGRFLSADSVVPGAAAGSGGAAATLGYDDTQSLRPLTVDFHEKTFLETVNREHDFTLKQGFWFQLSDEIKKDAEIKEQWGPKNAQALNRYAYVLNNPLRYTDLTGHESCGGNKWKKFLCRVKRFGFSTVKLTIDFYGIIGVTSIFSNVTKFVAQHGLKGALGNSFFSGLSLGRTWKDLQSDIQEVIDLWDEMYEDSGVRDDFWRGLEEVRRSIAWLRALIGG